MKPVLLIAIFSILIDISWELIKKKQRARNISGRTIKYIIRAIYTNKATHYLALYLNKVKLNKITRWQLDHDRYTWKISKTNSSVSVVYGLID